MYYLIKYVITNVNTNSSDISYFEVQSNDKNGMDHPYQAQTGHN